MAIAITKKTMDFDRMIRYGTSPEVVKYREVKEIRDLIGQFSDIRDKAQTIDQINAVDLQITQLKRNIVLKYPRK